MDRLQPWSRVWLCVWVQSGVRCAGLAWRALTLSALLLVYLARTLVRSDHNRGVSIQWPECSQPLSGILMLSSPLFCNRNRFIQNRNHLKQFQLKWLQCDDPVSPQCQPHKVWPSVTKLWPPPPVSWLAWIVQRESHDKFYPLNVLGSHSSASPAQPSPASHRTHNK